jgi:TPR repeat protein
MNAHLGAIAVLVVILCPACGVTPDFSAPATAPEEARSGLVDAPNGVCRPGAQRLEHFGCVDEGLSFSVDAVEACRAAGEAECDARCQRSDPPSCTALALVHQLALESSPNTTYATRLFEIACKAGDGAGCNDLGILAARGIGQPVDVERAEGLFSVACVHGDIIGCANLTSSRAWGPEPPPHVVQAAQAVATACDSGAEPHACAALGWMRARGSAVGRDEGLAVTLFDKACQAGDVGACEHLGRAYLAGDGVPPDDVTALHLFRRGCDQSLAGACTDLATMYCMGRGVPRDPQRSTALLRQSCEAGDAAACRTKACASGAPL